MSTVNLNTATSLNNEEVKQVMDYHAWDDKRVAKGLEVRIALGNALAVIVENVPPCPDRSAAIRKLRECRMDCNSAITHDGAF